MTTPLETLQGQWQENYSHVPFETFIAKYHEKNYGHVPISDFTDKLGLTVPPSPIRQEPSPMSPVEGASPWAVGEGPEPSQVLRQGAPIAAGLAGGMIPGAGFVAGPLAAATTDLLMSKAYGEGQDSTPRETSFLTDVGVGLLPTAAKGAYGIAKKMIPAPLEAKIASIVRRGIEKGIRPSVSGKGNFPQTEKYYKRAQSAVESIIENKPNLQFTDEAGGTVRGALPKNLSQFSGAIDQTKRSIFKQYDSMIRASEDLGRTVDLNPIVSELKAFSGNKINQLAGGTGLNRAQELTMGMAGQKLTLSEAQDLLATLNGRTKAFLRNPTPDQVSSFAVDTMAANQLRRALDTAVEKSGYSALKNKYGALREIEKEVQHRATVDARKNTMGLIDYSDIFTAGEAMRALATMNPATAAGAGVMRAMKEWYKYINNPNNIIKSMFADTEKLIGRRPVGSTMKALPPGPRRMESGLLDDSSVRGVPAEIQRREGLLALPPKGSTIRPIETLSDYEKLFSVRPQVR